jgi:hypothetical protein
MLILLLVLRWLQPFFQLLAYEFATTVAGTFGILQRFTITTLTIAQNHAWSWWIYLVQIIIILIATTLYQTEQPRQPRCPSKWWRLGAKVIIDVSNTLGDTFERPARPQSKCRRRKLISTTLRYRRSTQLLVMTVLAMQAHATISTEREVRFDADSDTIGIDNRCSACISHVSSDFEGEFRDCDRVIKDFGGTRTTNIKVGTLKW